MGNNSIPQQNGIIYLGLPSGDKDYINNFKDEKIRNVEKSLFSLYPIGCKPRCMKPTTSFFIIQEILPIDPKIFI